LILPGKVSVKLWGDWGTGGGGDWEAWEEEEDFEEVSFKDSDCLADEV
jgi:hypothetical protein